ncbi:MAG: hypothetical protein AAF436_22380 [Myxococcota bacterium]
MAAIAKAHPTTFMEPEPREARRRSQSGTRIRALEGMAPAKRKITLEVPCVRVAFQLGGVARRVNWRCADSAADRCAPSGERRTRRSTSISLTLDHPSDLMTDVDLAGIVLIDTGRRQRRRLEPFRITDVMNLGRALTTTERSVLSYRIYDHDGTPIGTAMTKAAASFKAGSSFHLFFPYTDSNANPGRVAMFADVDVKPEPVVSCQP